MSVIKYGTRFSTDVPISLVKETVFSYDDKGVNTAEKIVDMLNVLFESDRQTEEHVYLICFSAALDILGVFEIGIGTITKCDVGVREIYQKALLCGAKRIVIAHNHPSGDPTISNNDIAIAERIHDAGELLDVKEEDFIVIGKSGTYYSAKGGGILL